MIAKTIARQIGNQALVMIGAKNLIDTGNGLLLKVGRNAKGVNYLKIILDANDTYTMSAFSTRGIKITPKGEMSGLYNDQLNTAIESLTGMYTRL
jgi:hypothetical protein